MTADVSTWFLQGRGNGSHNVRGKVSCTTSRIKRMQSCREIGWELFISVSYRERAGGVGTGEAWVLFINKQLNTVGGFLV